MATQRIKNLWTLPILGVAERRNFPRPWQLKANVMKLHRNPNQHRWKSLHQSKPTSYQRVRTKYGAIKLSEHSDANPLVIERIISALTSRGREYEIFHMIERYMDSFDDLHLGNILDIKLKNESLLCESWRLRKRFITNNSTVSIQIMCQSNPTKTNIFAVIWYNHFEAYFGSRL